MRAYILIVIAIVILGIPAVQAMGNGGAGHGSGSSSNGSHGGMKPSNATGGGGTYNLPAGVRAHAPITPSELLDKRIKYPRS